MSITTLHMQYNLNIAQKTFYEQGYIGEVDTTDVCILHFISQFINQPKIESHKDGKKTWYWIASQYIIDQLPILNIKSKKQIRRRLTKYVELGLIESKVECTKNFYHFKESFYKLYPREYIGAHQCLSDVVTNVDTECTSMSNNHNTNIIVPISNIYIEECFNKFWKEYPNTNEEVKISTRNYFIHNQLYSNLTEILKALHHYKKTKKVKDRFIYAPIRFLKEVYPNYIEGIPEDTKQNVPKNQKFHDESLEFLEKIEWLHEKWVNLNGKEQEAIEKSNADNVTKKGNNVFTDKDVEVIRKAGGVTELVNSYSSNSTKKQIQEIMKNGNK